MCEKGRKLKVFKLSVLGLSRSLFIYDTPYFGNEGLWRYKQERPENLRGLIKNRIKRPFKVLGSVRSLIVEGYKKRTLKGPLKDGYTLGSWTHSRYKITDTLIRRSTE